MAILTVHLEDGLFECQIYAEFSDGVLEDVYLSIKIDGYPVTWSPFQKHGEIQVVSMGSLCRDWERLLALINPVYGKMIQDALTPMI